MLPLVLENADVSPSKLWNKIIKGKSDFLFPQKPNRSSTSTTTSTIPLKLGTPILIIVI